MTMIERVARALHVGDMVTRDGTDIHRVTREDDGYGCIRVECVVAPKSGWTKVGDTEDNLAGRYSLVTTWDLMRTTEATIRKAFNLTR